MQDRVSLNKVRRNAIIGGIALVCIATLHLIKGHTEVYRFLYGLAGFLFIAGGLFPKAFKNITGTIGKIIVSLLLSVVFFMVITPIGIVMRLIGKDTLDKDIDTGKASYWVDKAEEDNTSMLEKQY